MKVNYFNYPLDYLAPAGLAVAGSAAALAFSSVEPIRIIALLVLSAAGYGIANDLIGCRKCIEYFTLGHTPFHKRLIPSNDPNLNAIVWGVHATWGPAALAGVLVAIASHARASKYQPVTAKQLFPILAVASAVLLAIAHIYSSYMENYYSKRLNNPNDPFHLAFTFNKIIGEPGCQDVYLNQVPKNKRAAWLANGERNLAGYLGLGIGGTALICAIIGFRLLRPC